MSAPVRIATRRDGLYDVLVGHSVFSTGLNHRDACHIAAQLTRWSAEACSPRSAYRHAVSLRDIARRMFRDQPPSPNDAVGILQAATVLTRIAEQRPALQDAARQLAHDIAEDAYQIGAHGLPTIEP